MFFIRQTAASPASLPPLCRDQARTESRDVSVTNGAVPLVLHSARERVLPPFGSTGEKLALKVLTSLPRKAAASKRRRKRSPRTHTHTHTPFFFSFVSSIPPRFFPSLLSNHHQSARFQKPLATGWALARNAGCSATRRRSRGHARLRNSEREIAVNPYESRRGLGATTAGSL